MCIIIASKFCGFKNNHYLCTRNSEMIDDRGVEQLVARQAHNLEVACSSPASATNNDITSCKNNELCRFFCFILRQFCALHSSHFTQRSAFTFRLTTQHVV